MEHHANIVPWQMLCEEKGARLRVIPMNDAGELLLDEYDGLLNERTKLVAVMHVSNALGTINPIKEMIAGAQVWRAGADRRRSSRAAHARRRAGSRLRLLRVFRHKMFAPTGSGVVYGKLEILETMNPFQGGGDMIKTVTFEKTTYADPPNRFEAGTPAIASQIGLGRHRLFEQHRQERVRLLTKPSCCATRPSASRRLKACGSSAPQSTRRACSRL